MRKLSAGIRAIVAERKEEIKTAINNSINECSSTKEAFEALYIKFNGYARETLDNTDLFDFEYNRICSTLCYNTRSKKITLSKMCDLMASNGNIARENYYW